MNVRETLINAIYRARDFHDYKCNSALFCRRKLWVMRTITKMKLKWESSFFIPRPSRDHYFQFQSKKITNFLLKTIVMVNCFFFVILMVDWNWIGKKGIGGIKCWWKDLSSERQRNNFDALGTRAWVNRHGVIWFRILQKPVSDQL